MSTVRGSGLGILSYLFGTECSRDRALPATRDTNFQPALPSSTSYQMVYSLMIPRNSRPWDPCYVFRIVDGPAPTGTSIHPTTPASSIAPTASSDTMIALTFDPRFPVTRSAAIPDATTYTLQQPPANGTVMVDLDGQFTYATAMPN